MKFSSCICDRVCQSFDFCLVETGNDGRIHSRCNVNIGEEGRVIDDNRISYLSVAYGMRTCWLV